MDLLWSHPESPWYHRINMLGESGSRGLKVTQAAWVRSLLASFIKSWEGPQVQIGGLFGTKVGQHKTILSWNCTDQAAFLIVMGQLIRDSILKIEELWAVALRRHENSSLEGKDLAFFGQNTLMNQDQGVRILLQVVNDLCFVQADELALDEWGGEQEEEESHARITASIRSLKEKEKIIAFLTQLSDSLATYDWRASSGPELTGEQRTRKAAFRGSGGYRELRKDVLEHLAKDQGQVAKSANEVMKRLGY